MKQRWYDVNSLWPIRVEISARQSLRRSANSDDFHRYMWIFRSWYRVGYDLYHQMLFNSCHRCSISRQRYAVVIFSRLAMASSSSRRAAHAIKSASPFPFIPEWPITCTIVTSTRVIVCIRRTFSSLFRSHQLLTCWGPTGYPWSGLSLVLSCPFSFDHSSPTPLQRRGSFQFPLSQHRVLNLRVLYLFSHQVSFHLSSENNPTKNALIPLMPRPNTRILLRLEHYL